MSTRNLIIKVAREIFLEKGFKKANIRDIANEAEVSTGAIYGYFVNKEKLFEAAIGPLPKEYYHKYLKALTIITDTNYLNVINKVKQGHYDSIELFLDYVYADFTAWKLVINGEGTNYNSQLKVIINKEISSFTSFMNLLESENVVFTKPNPAVINALITNLIDNLVGVIKLEMDRDEAIEYSKQIADFFFEGWRSLLKIQF